VLKLARHLGHLCKPKRAFVLSAQRGAGARSLRQWLVEQAVPDEWEFPQGTPTDLGWPELTAELVREKLYWAHTHEVPYKLRPVCTSVREMSDGRISAAVVSSLANAAAFCFTERWRRFVQLRQHACLCV
jgi:GTPase